MQLVKRLARILPFLTWIISSILTVIDVAVLRTTIVTIADAINRAIPIEDQVQRGWLLRWPVSAIDQFAILILGAVALGLVISFDFIYRTALQKGTLKHRFALVTTVQIAVFIACGIVLVVLKRAV